MKQPVYHYNLTDLRIQAAQIGNGRGSVFVACDTQKRAAELMGIRPDELRTYGGVGGQKPVEALCRSEPETIFVEIRHGLYGRIDELADPSKHIALEMKDEELYGRDTHSAAFGMISAARVSGQTNLFMVDYPQEHFLTITISTATLNRNLASDRVMADKEIVQIGMSEVQWARMIASPNTQGVPCTLRHYREPLTGEFLTPRLPESHVADAATFVDEVKDRAKQAAEGLSAAQARLAEIMKGPLRKSDLAEVEDMLRRADMMLSSNLGYVVKRAEETIQDAVENAKTEISAHVDYAMTKLGERALGERLAQALEAGEDIAGIGRRVALALDDRAQAPKESVD